MRKLATTLCLTLGVLLVTPIPSYSENNKSETVSGTMVVLGKLASELLESLDTRKKIAIRPLLKKETGLSDTLNLSLING